MRVDMTWQDVPVEVRIINTPSKYNFVDPVDIIGFDKVTTRSRCSSFSSSRDVVDVEGGFEIGLRNGVGGMMSIVNSIEIPALDIELSLIEFANREYTKDSEERIQTTATKIDSDFDGINYGNMPDVNVTTIRITIDYETKEVDLDREYGGIEWGRYYE